MLNGLLILCYQQSAKAASECLDRTNSILSLSVLYFLTFDREHVPVFVAFSNDDAMIL